MWQTGTEQEANPDLQLQGLDVYPSSVSFGKQSSNFSLQGFNTGSSLLLLSVAVPFKVNQTTLPTDA